MSEKEYILQLKGISKEFPGVKALNNINISFALGEIHSVVGENGAGKSTMMNIIDGTYAPTEGKLFVEGHETVMSSPLVAQKYGIAMMHQEGSLLMHLTVMENIFLNTNETYPGGFLKKKLLTKKTQELLDMLHLEGIKPNQYIRELSIGQRRLVEVAKVLESSSKLLIMDEPTASLTEKETRLLLNVLKDLRKKQNIAIIYISHRLEEVFEISDMISVLRDGNYVGTYPIKDITTQELITLMVGRELSTEIEQIKKTDITAKFATNKTVLSIRNLNIASMLKDINFDLYKGEILGFAGLVGAGRTEIAEAIMGYRKADSIEIVLEGKKIINKNPSVAIKNRFSMTPEDRRDRGVFPMLSVRENINLVNLANLRGKVLLSERKQNQKADEYIHLFSIKTPSIKKYISQLSGGNQQKAVLARFLSQNMPPKVLILDEPTYGVDVGAKAEIYKIIWRLREQGISIILISSEMEELMLLSSRIMVLHEGSITGMLDRMDFDQKHIMCYASGITDYA